MKKYTVEVTDDVKAAIRAQARYIALEKQEPISAQRWIESAWDAVDSLETLPKRCSLAEENEDVDYEVRQLSIGGPTLLLTVDDDRRIVWVIAMRGDGQLPRPQNLSNDIGSPGAAPSNPTEEE